MSAKMKPFTQYSKVNVLRSMSETYEGTSASNVYRCRLDVPPRGMKTIQTVKVDVDATMKSILNGREL